MTEFSALVFDSCSGVEGFFEDKNKKGFDRLLSLRAEAADRALEHEMMQTLKAD